jgi:hypothetical protein
MLVLFYFWIKKHTYKLPRQFSGQSLQLPLISIVCDNVDFSNRVCYIVSFYKELLSQTVVYEYYQEYMRVKCCCLAVARY